jgi:outer membrane protein assembly factor BamB
VSFAAPVVADGFVWIGTNNESPRDPERTEPAPALMCFRERDGEFVWQYFAPLRKGTRYDDRWTGIKCSPLIEGGRLWLTTPGADVVCLDIGPLLRGEGMPKEIWKLNMPAELGVFVHPRVMAWPGANSVALYREWIHVTTDNGMGSTHTHVPAPPAPSLLCLEKETGKPVWQDNSPGTNIFHIQWSSPLALEVEGEGRVFAGGGDGVLRAFDAETGEKIWELDCNPPEYRKKEYPAPNGPSEILATPVYDKGRIYVTIGQEPEHGVGVGNLVCADAKTGKLIWQNKTIHRSISSAVVVEENVYVPDLSGFLYCVDANTGNVRWRFDAEAHIWSSPLYADGMLYLGDDDGDAMVFDLARIEQMAQEKGKPFYLDERALGLSRKPDTSVVEGENQLIWQTSMHAPLVASPVLANGVLYLNAGSQLCAITASSDALEIDSTVRRQQLPDAIYVPTPQDVVERTLELAETREMARVVDLGSGDGRIVITAARKYGAHAVGYEMDPRLVEKSRRNVSANRLDRLVRIEEKDLFSVSLREVDIVALFLPPRLMARLLPELRHLKPGARIVSHDFVFPEIPPDKSVTMISSEDSAEHRIHLWKAPLKLGTDRVP